MPTQPQAPPRARGFLPDAVTPDKMLLLKACSRLHLTYEIRLATFMASQTNRRLYVDIPPSASISDELRAFASEYGVAIGAMKR